MDHDYQNCKRKITTPPPQKLPPLLTPQKNLGLIKFDHASRHIDEENFSIQELWTIIANTDFAAPGPIPLDICNVSCVNKTRQNV